MRYLFGLFCVLAFLASFVPAVSYYRQQAHPCRVELVSGGEVVREWGATDRPRMVPTGIGGEAVWEFRDDATGQVVRVAGKLIVTDK